MWCPHINMYVNVHSIIMYFIVCTSIFSYVYPYSFILQQFMIDHLSEYLITLHYNIASYFFIYMRFDITFYIQARTFHI